MPNTCCPEFFMYCCADGFPLFATKFLLLLLVAIFKLAMYAFLYSGVFILCIMNIMIMNIANKKHFIFFGFIYPPKGGFGSTLGLKNPRFAPLFQKWIFPKVDFLNLIYEQN